MKNSISNSDFYTPPIYADGNAIFPDGSNNYTLVTNENYIVGGINGKINANDTIYTPGSRFKSTLGTASITLNVFLPVSAAWDSVTYGNGSFVAVAFGSANAASSSDGITWAQRTMPVSTSWESVTYGNGSFVAVAFGSSYAASSSDGITWKNITPYNKIPIYKILGSRF